MTTVVATVIGTTDTIRAGYIAPTYKRENIEVHAGTLTTEQLRFVQAVTDALQTFLLSGRASSKDTWEIQITRRRKDSPGKSESTPRPKEKKSPNTTEKNSGELKLKEHLGNVDIYG